MVHSLIVSSLFRPSFTVLCFLHLSNVSDALLSHSSPDIQTCLKREERLETGWKRREEAHVRDWGMDRGMPVLIRVWEQRLSVRCLPVNEPVSLQYYWDGGRRSCSKPDDRNVRQKCATSKQKWEMKKKWKKLKNKKGKKQEEKEEGVEKEH